MANTTGSSSNTPADNTTSSDADKSVGRTTDSFSHYLTALAQCSTEGVAFVNSDGVVDFVNYTAATLIGRTQEELLGVDFFSLVKPTSCSIEDISLKRVWRGQFQLLGLEQTLDAVVQHTAPVPGRGPGMVVCLNVEGSSLQTPPQTFHQTKLEALGVLSSSIVHDLNNILTGILGHVSFLRLSLPPEVTDQESLGAIEDGARKAASMTQQVLEFAKGEELVLGPVNISRVINDGLTLLSASLPENVQLNVHGTEDEVHVVGDEGQLNQLILNLTVNARDALPDGGTITVELGTRVFSDSVHCSELGIEVGDYVLLSIKDNGQGISDEVRDRVFEPFFTTKAQHGTGLGLATVQAIVKAHRGVLSLHTAAGQGSCFEIALPSSSAVEDLIADSDDEALPTGTERILVVDDEETVRTIIQRSLEHLGYEVVVASDGVEALEIYADSVDSFALVIIDMIMPKMPGDELFYRLQEQNPHVQVLIASGYASDSRTKAILDDGALAFIQKPFAVEELAQEVRQCLDQELEIEEAA